MLDVEKKTWSVVTQSGDVPSVRHGASAVVHNERLYVFGGATAKNKALDDFYSFQFASGVWTRIAAADGPSKRYFAATTIAGDKLYVHGGEVNIKTQVADFYEFAFADSKWRKLTVGGAVALKERAGASVSVSGIVPFNSGNQVICCLPIPTTPSCTYMADLVVSN